MNANPRIIVAMLTLSAAGFLGIVGDEWFTGSAVIPVPGDPPTIGFGSTKYEDGSPVKMGDKITPPRALIVAKAHTDKDEERFRASLPGVLLHQSEYDLYLNFVYQYGAGNWAESSMRRDLLAGNYEQACHDLLKYRNVRKADCSDPKNWNGKGADCHGVWTRQQARHAQCMAAQ